MAATATLTPAPPLAPPNRVGRLATAATVIESSDPHVGLGVVYERDVQIEGTAIWDSTACETAGADNTGTELSGTVTGIPYVVFQMAQCRMINEWNTLGGRLGTIFEAGEWRTVEEAFATALAAGDYGTVSAGPTATNAGPKATFAIAESYIADNLAYGVILASPEIVSYATANNLIVRDGDRLFTVLGTPVVSIIGLGDDLYVTGQIVIYRGPRSDPRPAQSKTTGNYNNEFVVLTERVYTIAVEGAEDDGSMEIVKWTVNLTL
jgi:hypothetical protein